jgi:phosphoglycolate phosphatase
VQYIFDLDGTLLDSQKGILDSLKYSINKHAPIYLPKINKGLIGPPINILLRKIISSEQLIEAISLEFRNHYDDKAASVTKLFPGVYKGLEELNINNKLFISTNKPLIPTMKILYELEIDKFFCKILTIDSEGCSSKTEIVNKILSENDASESVVIGDSTDDYESAKGNKINFIYCSYGYGYIKNNHKKIMTINSSKDLFGFLAKKNFL